MPPSISQLLRYWRSALLDTNRHINPDSLSLYALDRSRLAEGRIDGDARDGVWRDAEATMKAKERKETRSIAVLVAPQILEPEHEHSAAFSTLRRARVPLWVPARLDREGVLSPLAFGAPMVDRAVLAPLTSGVPTFSSVSEIDRFLDDHPPPADDSGWGKLWEYVTTLYTELFGGPPGECVPERHVDLGAFVAFGTKPIDSTRPIRDVYEALIERDAGGAEPPVLFHRLLNPSEPLEAASAPECRQALARRHLGQMGGEYPLNAGQRLALSAVIAAGTGDIVAVNGPPGTGKTTLIQSVVASLWVERAMAKDGEPPVILTSSTNNKAITNVLDTFARATLPDGHPLAGSPLVERWLPDLIQYGLFLPSSEQLKKGVDPRYAQAWSTTHGQPWSGLPGTMESQDYLDKAEPYWLESFTCWNGGAEEALDGAVETLRQSLANRVGAIQGERTARATLLSEVERLGLQDCARAIEHVRAELTDLRPRLEDLNRLGHRAMQLIQGNLLESLLGWLTPIRRRLWTRTHAFLAENRLADPSWTWATMLSAAQFHAWLATRNDDLRRRIGALETVCRAWDTWREAATALGLAHGRPEDTAATEASLDTLVRPELFHMAARYWEGRWLMEMKSALARAKDSNKVLTGRNRAFCEQRWRRFAKLTPCLVATAYTAPRLFDFYESSRNRPLVDFIDLLIVDEAGQIAPQTGGALFALAGTAMVVGDVLQIEPVWGIEDDVDDANLGLFDLAGQRPALEGAGMLAAEGSVMALARSATSFKILGQRGMFLDEHWRCRRTVISYCNELAYGGALKPMRTDSPYPLPPLGYAHVPGRAGRAGTSWTNADEASVIAQWLKGRKAGLIEHHAGDEKPPANLGGIVAIVTPFKAQIGVIRKALSDAGLGSEDITVGTVHALQGAEKAVVLFSPVYSPESGSRLFFDRSASMLNVAVSRARESFLVFGDQRLFRADQPSRPSGLLARYLVAEPGNEITDIEPLTQWAREPTGEVERVDDLDGHRRLLRQAAEQSRERLLVVSPYLSHAAIAADEIISPLRDAHRRGVRVVVAYDPQLNTGRDGRLRATAKAALEALNDAQAEIWPLNGAHNKTLAVDDLWIAEGSFNWLAAVRDRDHAFHRQEVSIIYRGKKTPSFTERAWMQAEKIVLQEHYVMQPWNKCRHAIPRSANEHHL